MPVQYKKMRDKWVAFDPAMLATLPSDAIDAAAADAKKRFPTLTRPKGKSAGEKNPIMIDWAPPETLKMSIDLHVHDMKKDPAAVETARAKYKMPSTASVDEIADRFARERHFVASENPSQFIHGTVFALVAMLGPGASRKFAKFDMDFDEESAMLLGMLDLCLATGYLVGRVNGVDVSAVLDSLKAEFEAIRPRILGA